MLAKGLVLFTIFFFISLPSYAVNTPACSTYVQKGTVALTFDDGPSATYTQKVMKILDHYHIKATFFLVGEKALQYPKIVEQLFAKGEGIGNHSMTHPNIATLNDDQLEEEIVKPKNILYKITGKQPALFRFPYAAENKHVKDYVVSQGMTPVPIGYSADDYKLPGADVIAERIIAHAHSGSILLLHDGPSKRQQTVDALPKIIEGIQKKGLGFSVICG